MKFTDTHEWVKGSSNEAIVGITTYAQQELGEIVYVELPEVGRSVKKGDPMAVLESTKAASDLYFPCSGKVLEVNLKLQETPGLINQDPEGEGWILKLQLSHPKELEDLLDKASYQELIG